MADVETMIQNKSERLAQKAAEDAYERVHEAVQRDAERRAEKAAAEAYERVYALTYERLSDESAQAA